jgi:hypothetical protein
MKMHDIGNIEEPCDPGENELSICTSVSSEIKMEKIYLTPQS